MILVCLILIVGGGVLVSATGAAGIVIGILAIILAVFGLMGLYMVQPNEAVAILLFGAYRGTDRAAGLRWVLPWYIRKKISLRTRNVTSDRLKVNDKRGNPIEIAAVVVWHVHDTARAAFEVDDYENFVKVQSEAAVRHLASSFAYDEDDTSGEPAQALGLLESRQPSGRRAPGLGHPQRRARRGGCRTRHHTHTGPGGPRA